MQLSLVFVSAILFATTLALPKLPTIKNISTDELPKVDRFQIISYQKMSWYGALHTCKLSGMELASVHNEQDQENLKALLDSKGTSGQWWTAGNDLTEEKSYFWVSDGTPLIYTNWGSGFPNNLKATNCITVHHNDGYWRDQVCETLYNFVCEN